MNTVGQRMLQQAETRRKLRELAKASDPITWETLEDKSLNCYFESLPTRKEISDILSNCSRH